NVGCHTDAHEQAKWFGDDIAFKSDKYDDVHGIRAAVNAVRMIGAGSPPLHRFRVGLELAVSGRQDITGMSARHSALARPLADRLGLPDAVQRALAASYEQWDGKGWPGQFRGADVPVASRIAQIAEFGEVAHRVGGVAEAQAVASRRAGAQF